MAAAWCLFSSSVCPIQDIQGDLLRLISKGPGCASMAERNNYSQWLLSVLQWAFPLYTHTRTRQDTHAWLKYTCHHAEKNNWSYSIWNFLCHVRTSGRKQFVTLCLKKARYEAMVKTNRRLKRLLCLFMYRYILSFF